MKLLMKKMTSNVCHVYILLWFNLLVFVLVGKTCAMHGSKV